LQTLDEPTTTKRAAAHATARPAGAKPKAAPTKEQLRTLLVASCGWPTDAAAPGRRRAARR